MASIKLTDAVADALAEAVADGVPIETAAAAAGLSTATIYNWLQAAKTGIWPQSDSKPRPEAQTRLVDFLDRITRAQAEFEAKQVAGIARAAEVRNEKTGQQDWRARAWLLNNHPRTRDRYHEIKEQQVEQRELSPVYRRAREMSDDELEREYARVQALPAAGEAMEQRDG